MIDTTSTLPVLYRWIHLMICPLKKIFGKDIFISLRTHPINPGCAPPHQSSAQSIIDFVAIHFSSQSGYQILRSWQVRKLWAYFRSAYTKILQEDL